MQLYKAFFKIAKRNFLSIFIYFAIFFMICFVFASNGTSSDASRFDAEKAVLAIVDRDQSSSSKALAAYLGTMQNRKEIPSNPDFWQDELYYRHVDYILIIPKGYEEKLKKKDFTNLTENVKIPASLSGTYIDQQIEHYLRVTKTYLVAGYDTNEALKAAANTSKFSTEVTLSNQDNNRVDSAHLLSFYQYYTYIIVCITLAGLGSILFRFEDKNISARLHASAMTLRQRNLALFAGSCTLSILYWLALVVASALFYRNQFFSKIGLLCIANSFLYMLVCASLTFLLSNFAKSLTVFPVLSNVIGLGMSFLCGVFVPIEFMGKQILTVAHLFPAYWYMDAHKQFTNFVSTGAGGSTIAIAFLIEALFALAFLSIGFVVTKLKRSNA